MFPKFIHVATCVRMSFLFKAVLFSFLFFCRAGRGGVVFIIYLCLAAQCHIWDLSFPNQGSNPCLLHWEHGVLTTGLSGKILSCLFLTKVNFPPAVWPPEALDTGCSSVSGPMELTQTLGCRTLCTQPSMLKKPARILCFLDSLTTALFPFTIGSQIYVTSLCSVSFMPHI